MSFITYKSISGFIATLPEGSSESMVEEYKSAAVPENYNKIGTLKDDCLCPSPYSYKPWTHYALGFYPFNDCDIFRDENDQILFSYVEYGGHSPFRRSFVVNKNSPITEEPVCFRLSVKQSNHSNFFSQLVEWGLDQARFKQQLKEHAQVRSINDDLSPNALKVIRQDALADDSTQFVMIAPRSKAVVLSRQFNN